MLKVECNHVITVVYELREANAYGELIEKMSPNRPFSFVFGCGQLLQSFENQLLGLHIQDSFEFVLNAKNAYGAHEPASILDLPIHIFEQDGQLPLTALVVGNTIKLTDDRNEEHHGCILSVQAEVVTVDFNHPMAGKDLYFRGTILQIRAATPVEILQKSPLF